jgi:anti-sigma B factor antagonist
MNIGIRKCGLALVLELHGQLTVDDDIRPLWDIVETAPARGGHLVLSLENVSRLDCTGIGELVALHRAVHEAGAVLSLVNPQPRQKRMLELVGLLRVLNVHDDLNTALALDERGTETMVGGLYPGSIPGGYPDTNVIKIAAIAPHVK